MPMLLDENEDQDVLKNGTGLTASQRLPASYAGASGPAMPLEDTTDFEAGGPAAQPRAPMQRGQMGLMADLNGNGIPDGAEITFKQDRGDGSTITAKWQHAMEMFDDRAPKFQPGALPAAPGAPFDPNGSMAPYNRLGPSAQARILGYRTIEGQRRFNEGQTNTYNAAIANEANRKLAYDLQKSAALTKLGTGLMQLEGHDVDAGAQQTAALLRMLGVGETADAKRYSSDNSFAARDLVSGRALQGDQLDFAGKVASAGITSSSKERIAEGTNQTKRDIADANNRAQAEKPIKFRNADGSEQFMEPLGDGLFRMVQPSTNGVPRVNPPRPQVETPPPGAVARKYDPQTGKYIYRDANGNII